MQEDSSSNDGYDDDITVDESDERSVTKWLQTRLGISKLETHFDFSKAEVLFKLLFIKFVILQYRSV